MHAIKVYADTSVFGGVFDDEFKEASSVFFDAVKSKRFTLVVSEVVEHEIENAPQNVKDFYEMVLPLSDPATISNESMRLQEAYIAAGIVSEKSFDDALHVALATVSDCNGIISWNFRHIVHFQKIPMYNAINMKYGYNPIFIHSPSEVMYEE